MHTLHNFRNTELLIDLVDTKRYDVYVFIESKDLQQ